jgi:hypothetical protein
MLPVKTVPVTPTTGDVYSETSAAPPLKLPSSLRLATFWILA